MSETVRTEERFNCYTFHFKMVKEMEKPTIFLIEEDDDARPIFREKLKNLGYKISLAVDEEDALGRIENECVRADLMLINLVKKTPEEVLKIARDISQKGKLNIPIVVIAAKYGADLEGTNIQVAENEYITYLEGADQLSALLSRLLPERL